VTGRRKGPARRFDHDQAREMHAAGESYAAIARAMGVTHGAIRRICDPAFRERMEAHGRTYLTSGTCSDCGGPRAHNPAADRTRAERGQAPLTRCRSCYYVWVSATKGTSARPGELHCSTCKQWKPDDAFYRSRSTTLVRRGRHKMCRECTTRARRDLRLRQAAA
jgi:hypothetical protein